MRNQLSVQIEKLVQGGEGLAHLPDGKAVFVPFVLPEEKVVIQIDEEKKHFFRAKLLEVISPSPHRILPRCPHYGKCGGCNFQHMDYETQTRLKSEILQDQLTRIGGFTNIQVPRITESPYPWNYRNQVQYHPTAQGGLGYKNLTGSDVVEIQECHLPSLSIFSVKEKIDLGSDAGITRLTIREDSQNELMLLIEGEEENGPELTVDMPISIAYRNPGGEVISLAGHDSLVFNIFDKQLSVSPESFFQVNIPVAQKMVSYILERLPKSNNLNILELYSGVGLFSIFLAEHASHLIAIESSPSACYDFAANLDAFNNVDLYEGSVEDTLPALVDSLDPVDLILLDPPRTGLHPKAREALSKLDCKQILYASCDPSTLARDLKWLHQAGYDLTEVQAFDMFPQTYHTEAIVFLSREVR